METSRFASIGSTVGTAPSNLCVERVNSISLLKNMLHIHVCYHESNVVFHSASILELSMKGFLEALATFCQSCQKGKWIFHDFPE